MIGPQGLREHVVDQIIRLVVAPLDLFQDDVLLPRQFLGVNVGVQEHVGEHVNGKRDMFGEDADVVAGALFGGEGVDVAPDRVNLVGDLLGRSASASP